MVNWELTGIFFQKLLCCNTTLPNFMFLEMWRAGKKDSLDTRGPQKHGPIQVNS